MQTKRIVHIITTIERGGAENAVATLAKSQAEKGLSVSVFPLKGKNELGDLLISKGVEVLENGFNKNIFRQILEIRKLRKKYSIYHAHLPRAELISRIALGPGSFVLTRHNAEPFFPSIPIAISSSLSRWVTKKTEVIAISKAVERFIRLNNELHASSNCHIIYYGFPTKKSSFITTKKNTLNELITLGSVSRLVPQKNLKLLIEGTKELISRGYHVRTLIAGVGGQRELLELYAQKLGIHNQVTFMGKLSNIPAFLSGLDVFVLTSDYEGFGLVLLEAMEAELPIVASNYSAIPEVLGSSHQGLFEYRSLASLVEKVEDLILNKKLRQSLISFQKQRLQMFNVDDYFAKHTEVYGLFKIDQPGIESF